MVINSLILYLLISSGITLESMISHTVNEKGEAYFLDRTIKEN